MILYKVCEVMLLIITLINLIARLSSSLHPFSLKICNHSIDIYGGWYGLLPTHYRPFRLSSLIQHTPNLKDYIDFTSFKVSPYQNFIGFLVFEVEAQADFEIKKFTKY